MAEARGVMWVGSMWCSRVHRQVADGECGRYGMPAVSACAVAPAHMLELLLGTADAACQMVWALQSCQTVLGAKVTGAAASWCGTVGHCLLARQHGCCVKPEMALVQQRCPMAAECMRHTCSTSSATCCVQDDDPPPTWSMGTPVPIGAALVALVGLVIAAMWVDTVASELVRLCSST